MTAKFIVILCFLGLSSIAPAQSNIFDNHPIHEQSASTRGTAEPSLDPYSVAETITDNTLGTPLQPINTDNTEQPTEEILLADKKLSEELISQSMVAQRWDWLAYLLPIYRQTEGFDGVLADYAEGALLRNQGKHRQAINLYRGIIARQPELVYVRMNLASMLFENKEYTAAKDQFEKVRTQNISAGAQQLVNQYLAAIDQNSGWQMGLGFSYEQTDNVNNASAAEEIILGNLTFKKNQESLPKKAHGFSYSGSLSRDFNLQGNHYLSLQTILQGVNYWNNHDYDQITSRVGVGYTHRNIKQWVSFTPYIEKTWLGGKSYNHIGGINTQYGHWFNANWQTVVSADFSRTEYHDNKSYDGNRLALSSSLLYLPTARLFMMVGVDWINEKTRDKAQASVRKSLRTGVGYEWTMGLSTRLNMRYTQRDFQANNFYYGFARKDDEYQSIATVWHRKLNFYGITPKFNWQYNKIDSNIPAFYSRSGSRFFIGLDKRF